MKIIQKIKRTTAALLCNGLTGSIIGAVYSNKIPYRSIYINTSNPAIPKRVNSLLLLNLYEKAEALFINKYLDKSIPVLELGGSIGVIASLIGYYKPKHQVCVEANPDLIPIIKDNLDLNDVSNIDIINMAVSIDNLGVEFSLNSDNLVGNIFDSTAKKIKIPSITLRELVDKYKWASFQLISDIEGAEVFFIKELHRIPECKRIIIETHDIVYENYQYTPEVIKEIILAQGYELINYNGPVFVFERKN